jgi:hypothetical protein
VYSNQLLEQPIVPNIKRITLDRALKTLAALGAEYIIKDSEGNMHSLGSGLPHGNLSKYISGYVDTMQVGDVVCVPMYEGGNMKSLHSTVSSYTLKMWGVGNNTTHRDATNNCVEVMRLG